MNEKTPQSSYRVWVYFMITSLSLLTVLMKETSLVFLQMNLWTEVTQSDHQSQGSDTHGGLTEATDRYEVLSPCEASPSEQVHIPRPVPALHRPRVTRSGNVPHGSGKLDLN